MLKQLDIWLVENVAERFTHWFQKLTGKNNFWLARLCAWQIIFFPMSALAVEAILQGSIHALLYDVKLPGSFITLGIVAVFYTLVIHIVEKATKKARTHDCMNPLKSIPGGIRYRFYNILLWSVILSGVWALVGLNNHDGIESMKMLLFSVVWLFPTIVIVHIMSCDPLPPSSEKSKITKWISAIRVYMTPTPQPVSTSSL